MTLNNSSGSRSNLATANFSNADAELADADLADAELSNSITMSAGDFSAMVSGELILNAPNAPHVQHAPATNDSSKFAHDLWGGE
jgi:uncharacterized protein YjbI with pentapeptide repeats